MLLAPTLLCCVRFVCLKVIEPIGERVKDKRECARTARRFHQSRIFVRIHAIDFISFVLCDTTKTIYKRNCNVAMCHLRTHYDQTNMATTNYWPKFYCVCKYIYIYMRQPDISHTLRSSLDVLFIANDDVLAISNVRRRHRITDRMRKLRSWRRDVYSCMRTTMSRHTNKKKRKKHLASA